MGGAGTSVAGAECAGREEAARRLMAKLYHKTRRQRNPSRLAAGGGGNAQAPSSSLAAIRLRSRRYRRSRASTARPSMGLAR